MAKAKAITYMKPFAPYLPYIEEPIRKVSLPALTSFRYRCATRSCGPPSLSSYTLFAAKSPFTVQSARKEATHSIGYASFSPPTEDRSWSLEFPRSSLHP